MLNYQRLYIRRHKDDNDMIELYTKDMGNFILWSTIHVDLFESNFLDYVDEEGYVEILFRKK